MAKPFFEPVDTQADFPSLEKKLLEAWYKKGIVKKYLQKNNNSPKRFSFLDGPITANNPMGVHHAWGRTYKDLWQRYHNMRGYKQRFQNGFDCQGLWVEVEVEKELGFNSKKDIEKFGLDNFSNECRKRVDKYSKIQTEQSKRLGQFMDWENSYYTFSDKNIEYIWYFLKKCHQKNWLYRGFRSLPWCPRCGTSLSQHELTDSYKEMTHKSVFFKLPISGQINKYFLVWTTTPWTLPANVALAVNPKVDYLEVKFGKESVILAEKLLRVLKDKYNIISKFKGSDLIDLGYVGPYDELSVQKESQRIVIGWEDVSDEEGTGIVHIAPGCGEEDFELGKRHKLKVLVPLDDNGNYLEGYGKLTGKFAHKVDEAIFTSLGSKGFLYKVENFTHQYPICWRCKKPIVFRAEENWFISSAEIRPKMVSEARKVEWRPKYVGKLMEDWLKNMEDWNISRKRYFGLPLPFYQCSCGKVTIAGSREELRNLAVDPKMVDKLIELHRPWIDEILIKCPDCANAVKRIADVGDCWLDAGIVPYSTLKYLEDKDYWKRWFPADWISEMREQIRLWFYSMLFMSITLEDRTPYLAVLSYEKLYDEKGIPMHKSAGNAIWFDEAVEKMGADVMRWMYAKQNPAENLLFGYKVADEIRRKFHLKLWNVYNFFVTFASIDGFVPGKNTKPKNGSSYSILDKWILARLSQTAAGVREFLEKFDAASASAELEKFVDDLSNWYVRRSRERVGPAVLGEKGKYAFYNTTYFVLVSLAKLLAPFCPFMAETIFRNLTKNESVHLTAWPDFAKGDLNLIAKMQKLREIVEKVHAQRKSFEIPVRQPLRLLKVKSPDQKPADSLINLLLAETNVEAVSWEKGSQEVVLDTKITPDLEEKARARELIRDIQAKRKALGVKLTQRITVKTNWLPKSENLINEIKRKTFVSVFSPGEFEVIPD